MFLKNSFYEIEINVIKDFTEESVKNGGYDFIHNPGGHNPDDELISYYDISIKSKNSVLKIALFGSCYIYDTDCAVLEGNVLTVLMDDEITRIDIESGELIFFKCIEIFGLGDHIYKVPGKYIIKGEIDIICLDEKFEKLWDFSSRDIFECINDNIPFVLCDDRIKLYNFVNDYFELDFDGNVIKEIINENAKF